MSDPGASPPEIVFCDQLTFLSCARAVMLFFRHRGDGVTWKIRVLDPLPTGRQSIILRALLKLLGVGVEEVEFFAGHLRTPDGKIAQVVAAQMAMELSFQAAESLLQRSRPLARLNNEWGRNTILLHLAKAIALSLTDRNTIYQYMLRLEVASALAHSERAEAYLILRQPIAFEPGFLRKAVPNVVPCFYAGASALIERKVVLVKSCLRAFHTSLAKNWRRSQGTLISGEGGNALCPEEKEPGLLLLQEDQLGLDRSYRTQPHWLFPVEARPPFKTYLLPTKSSLYPSYPRDALAEQGITLLEERVVAALSLPPSDRPIYRQLGRAARKCMLSALVSQSAEETVALSTVRRLLVQARALAALCERLNVRAFMTAENYFVQADAIQLIAQALDIHTISYQYSNIRSAGPLLMTTADTMLTFSSLYHDRWTRDGIRPASFIDIGYAFDSSFALIQKRAQAHRQRLEQAGARFIICHFDETVQNEKYGLISVRDHQAEILALVRLLLDDASLGLVVKTQYVRNSPRTLPDMEGPLASAKGTGRYVELVHGAHRNIILPAEAALTADIAIGHAVGATAPLEAALAGARCIILNPYKTSGGDDDLYAQADIMYSTITEAHDAIRQYRAGAPDRRNLGDWSPILHHFDPYRDGRAGHRMREILEKIVMRDFVKAEQLSHGDLGNWPGGLR
ncbi:MAG: hypothetical protein HY663_02320 [Chloroflexi bacterium]|nr:hypothetical protein [Chloroflexota bacterium]